MRETRAGKDGDAAPLCHGEFHSHLKKKLYLILKVIIAQIYGS
jgi:hypothetical protein